MSTPAHTTILDLIHAGSFAMADPPPDVWRRDDLRPLRQWSIGGHTWEEVGSGPLGIITVFCPDTGEEGTIYPASCYAGVPLLDPEAKD